VKEKGGTKLFFFKEKENKIYKHQLLELSRGGGGGRPLTES
jgi:hypothetical protein